MSTRHLFSFSKIHNSKERYSKSHHQRSDVKNLTFQEKGISHEEHSIRFHHIQNITRSEVTIDPLLQAE